MALPEANILLSASSFDLAKQRATRLGYANVSAYLEALIADEAIVDLAAPREVSPQSREELDAMVREGLASPTIPMGPEDWARMKSELIQKHAKRQSA